MNSVFKKSFAELFGTFLLTFGVYISLVGNKNITTFLVAGAILAFVVYVFGSVSGAHVNPAITLGALSINAIKPLEAGCYIVAQFLGAWLASVAGSHYMHGTANVQVADTIRIGIAEGIGASILALAVAAVIAKKIDGAAQGLVVGGSLSLGIVIASVTSNGVLNPAVAFGIGSFSAAYFLGPCIGAIVGMWLFRLIAE